jgi:hypothetical protein
MNTYALSSNGFSGYHMRKDKHAFSIEMLSKKYVKQIIVTNDANNRVLFEGFLGNLQKLILIDEEMLEIEGSYGTLRLDIHINDLKKVIKSNKK